MTIGKVRISETLVLGLLVIVQGAGSGLAKALWGGNWGLLAVAERWTPVPAWAGFALAAVGALIAVVGVRSSGRVR